jgi:hypothetical protein
MKLSLRLTEQEIYWAEREGSKGLVLGKVNYMQMISLSKIGNKLSEDVSGHLNLFEHSGVQFVPKLRT